MRQLKNFIILFIALSATLPIMYWIPSIRPITIILIFSWIFVDVLDIFMNKKRVPYYNIIAYFYLTYILIISYMSGNIFAGNKYIELFSIFLFNFAFEDNRKNYKTKSNFNIIRIVIIFTTFTYVRTMFELFTNPYIIRTIKSDGEYTINMFRQGIGGYAFLYYVIFIGIISFAFFIVLTGLTKFHKSEKQQKRIRTLMLVITIATIIIALKANYLTGIFLLLIGIFLLFYVSLFKFSLGKIAIGSIPILITLMFSWKVILTNILSVLISIIGDGWTSSRLMVLNASLVYGESLNNLTEQRDLTRSISIDAFKDNPFFGSIMNNLKGTGGELIGFGQHSFILDTFALFGAFIGLINIYLIIYPFISRLKLYSSITKWLSVILLFISVIFFYVNNAVPAIGFAIYMVFPYICEYIERNRLPQNYDTR